MNKKLSDQDILKYQIGQHIFIKKYHGDELKADESRSYEIISIGKTVLGKDSTEFIKNCTLDNGRTYPIYTYNILNKDRTYYIESAETWSRMLCCWNR